MSHSGQIGPERTTAKIIQSRRPRLLGNSQNHRLQSRQNPQSRCLPQGHQPNRRRNQIRRESLQISRGRDINIHAPPPTRHPHSNGIRKLRILSGPTITVRHGRASPGHPRTAPHTVMAGLVPAIHVFSPRPSPDRQPKSPPLVQRLLPPLPRGRHSQPNLRYFPERHRIIPGRMSRPQQDHITPRRPMHQHVRNPIPQRIPIPDVPNLHRPLQPMRVSKPPHRKRRRQPSHQIQQPADLSAHDHHDGGDAHRQSKPQPPDRTAHRHRRHAPPTPRPSPGSHDPPEYG